MTSDTLTTARWFAERGCSVIPIDHPAETTQTDPARIGKTPIVAWKTFQRAPPTDENLRAWFGNGHRRNIGIITGAISNLVVVDLDSPEAVAWADAQLPDTPWRIRTSKGEHRGFRHPGGIVQNAVRIDTGDPAIKVDVRGDGGFVVAPGSEHQSGARYEWVGEPPSEDALPVFNLEWLTAAVLGTQQKDQSPLPLPPSIPHGQQHMTLFREGCRLRRMGWEAVEIADALWSLHKHRSEGPNVQHERADIDEIAHDICKRYAPAADTLPTTETGDAEFFVACNAESVRYDHLRGRWLLFEEHFWKPQTNGEIARLALDSVRARQRAAIGDKERMRWAIGGESRTRQSNLLALAQNIIPITDAGESWDLDPWLLGVQNGVIDLHTGTLRSGRPEDRITMRVRVPFDPSATCPLYDKTLEEIFENNEPLIAYFDRYVGYSLTGDCREESLAFCWGGGANGKGTLMNTIGWLLGDYADDLPFSAFELQSRAGIPNDIAKIVNKRFITASETGETQRLNEARVKALTGRDPVTARFLHKEFFTFQPIAKFWLATNHKPEVRDDSEGFWRRLHLIPFAASFIGREDMTLKDRLRAEAIGILARAVRGCLAWQRQGLNPPDIVRKATKTYRADSMPLARFLDACCVVEEGARVSFGELFKAYVKWCGNSRDGRMGRHEFNDALRQRFSQDAKNTQRVTFLGVGLLDLFREGEM